METGIGWRRRFGATIACIALAACTHRPMDLDQGERAANEGIVVGPGDIRPADALARLKDGNRRFVGGAAGASTRNAERRLETARVQRPFAVVLACADSRTGPDIIFDQAIGDLFVVRVAGNVLDDHAIGSIEYAVEHLGARLILVLGHQRCGAVAAAREVYVGHGHAGGHIDSIVESIRPAVVATEGEDLEATCLANVRNVVESLRRSRPTLEPLVDSQEIAVLGAYYDLDSGVVTVLEPLPAQ